MQAIALCYSITNVDMDIRGRPLSVTTIACTIAYFKTEEPGLYYIQYTLYYTALHQRWHLPRVHWKFCPQTQLTPAIPTTWLQSTALMSLHSSMQPGVEKWKIGHIIPSTSVGFDLRWYPPLHSPTPPGLEPGTWAALCLSFKTFYQPMCTLMRWIRRIWRTQVENFEWS